MNYSSFSLATIIVTAMSGCLCIAMPPKLDKDVLGKSRTTKIKPRVINVKPSRSAGNKIQPSKPSDETRKPVTTASKGKPQVPPAPASSIHGGPQVVKGAIGRATAPSKPAVSKNAAPQAAEPKRPLAAATSKRKLVAFKPSMKEDKPKATNPGFVSTQTNVMKAKVTKQKSSVASSLKQESSTPQKAAAKPNAFTATLQNIWRRMSTVFSKDTVAAVKKDDVAATSNAQNQAQKEVSTKKPENQKQDKPSATKIPAKNATHHSASKTPEWNAAFRQVITKFHSLKNLTDNELQRAAKESQDLMAAFCQKNQNYTCVDTMSDERVNKYETKYILHLFNTPEEQADNAIIKRLIHKPKNVSDWTIRDKIKNGKFRLIFSCRGALTQDNTVAARMGYQAYILPSVGVIFFEIRPKSEY